MAEERRSAVFPAGTITRVFHHHKPPTRREQDLNLDRPASLAFLNEAVQ